MKKTCFEFVESLFYSTPVDVEPLDFETAEHDLENFKADGWELPEDLTPELYMGFWNDLVREQKNLL